VLALKVIAGTFLASTYARDLFVPFVNYFVESGFRDPWNHFAATGNLTSFPYPPIMLYVLALPRWLCSPLMSSGAAAVTPLHLFAMRLPLLACDIAIAALLASWFPNRRRLILLVYWCSPVAFYITYWHGQLDIIPTTLLLTSLFFVRSKRDIEAAVILGLGLGCKTHLLVAVPFLLLYVYRQSGWSRALRVGLVAAAVYLTVLLPFLSDAAFRTMVFGSPEQARAFALQFGVGEGATILLAPLAIGLLWFRFYGYPKHNWDLMMAYLGIVFCVFITLAPPRPAYFLWSLPFLAHYYCRQNEKRLAALCVYSVAYLLFFLVGPESDLIDAWRTALPGAAQFPIGDLLARWGLDAPHVTALRSLLFTTMVASMGGMVLPMWLVGVRSNEVYQVRKRPMLIGLAGDSGVGKDTICGLLSSALGAPRVQLISGDDYHRWPRGHEKWRVYTHLDARANDLGRQHDHAIAISQGNSILKGSYDHQTGQFTEARWQDPSEYVVFAGLHTLSVASQRQLYDLTVFVDPDEQLRQAWKIRRDCRDRGYSPDQVLQKLRERESDRLKYIQPQCEHADVIVRFKPLHPIDPTDVAESVPLRLEIVANNNFSFLALAERLEETESIRVQHDAFVDARRQSLVISGDLSAAQVRSLAESIIPNLEELVAGTALQGGLDGCLQLVLITCLSDRLRWSRRANDRCREENLACC
jgi:uridine kinase